MKNNNSVDIKFFKVKIMLIVLIGILFCAGLSIYLLYMPIYSDIIKSFQLTLDNVANTLYPNLSIDSFTEVEDIDDKTSEIYIRDHETLDYFRNLFNLEYLYTAGVNHNGDPIYIVDGLPLDYEYFVEPGELIETETDTNMLNVLSGKYEYYSDVIVADWGIVYFTGWPVYYYDNEIHLKKSSNHNLEPIGAIGMEIDVSEYYNTLKNSLRNIIVVTLAISTVILLLMYYMLGKVTHPYFRTLALTDFLTGLGSRNSFELDLDKIKSNSNTLVVVCDLNNLKIINDEYGHSSGDIYLKTFGKYLTELSKNKGSCYRIGGDEFVVIFENSTIKDSINIIDEGSALLTNSKYKHLEFAYGFAAFDSNIDKSINDTFVRADAVMYEMKKNKKTPDETFNQNFN
ncbi:MAG: GGDEF domain-containing protein [Lachnospirales bacterium]